MTFTCKCCYEVLEEEPPQYTLTGDTETYYISIYCESCVTYIHVNRWRLLKESLKEVDCLAELRRFCISGLPMSLVHGDLSDPKDKETGPGPDTEVQTVKFHIRSWSAKLDVDITEEERDKLMVDLRALQTNDVTESDIKTIYAEYFK